MHISGQIQQQVLLSFVSSSRYAIEGSRGLIGVLMRAVLGIEHQLSHRMASGSRGCFTFRHCCVTILFRGSLIRKAAFMPLDGIMMNVQCQDAAKHCRGTFEVKISRSELGVPRPI